MAIDVTVGGTSADSYATEAEADAYFGLRSGDVPTAWNAASTTAKENALKVAAQQMNCVRYFRQKFSLTNDLDNQALEFPRDYHTDPDDDDTAIIKQCIKDAQIIQAGEIVLQAGSSSTAFDSKKIAELRAAGVKKIQVGTTTIELSETQTISDSRVRELIEFGFTPETSRILSKFMAKIGVMTDDSQTLIRFAEIRTFDIFSSDIDEFFRGL